MEKVLITGATSSLGLKLASLYLQDGAQLTLSARQVESIPDDLLGHSRVKTIIQDFTDYTTIKEPLMGDSQDIVIHAAAVYTEGGFVKSSDEKLNSIGSFIGSSMVFAKTIIEASIHASSSTRFAIIGSIVTDERSPVAGVGPYAVEKASLQMLSNYINHEFSEEGVSSTYFSLGSFRSDDVASRDQERFLSVSAVASFIRQQLRGVNQPYFRITADAEK